jgi:hypothetical protein
MNLVDPTSEKVKHDFVENRIQLYYKIFIPMNKRVKEMSYDQIDEILTKICKLEHREMFCKSLRILHQVIYSTKNVLNDSK